VGYLNDQGFCKFDITPFICGGGTGLEVYNDDKPCQAVQDIKRPFVTAPGHQSDLVTLSKIADKNL